ncbi:MAG: 50S ribosomal protein L10 [Patescibacteria group bacterium]
MAISKQKKSQILDELNELLGEKSVLLLTTNDTKSTVNAVDNYDYRSTLYGKKVEVRIAKNTLIQRALENKGVTLQSDLFGQTYIQAIRGGDEVEVIKTVLDLVKDKYEDRFNIVGSVVSGEFMDAEKTKALSKVPTFSQSMSMVAGALNSVISKIAVGVREVPTGLARGVQAVSQQKS